MAEPDFARAALDTQRIRLSDADFNTLLQAIRVLNDVRTIADQFQTKELLFALNRANEVLAMLTRTKELPI